MKEEKIRKINWIDESEKYAIISGFRNYKKVPRLKELKKAKGNCYFTNGINHKLIDFIYRTAVKLNFREKSLFFSRGSVKRRGRPVINSVDVVELDWDVGISIIIPQRLNYNKLVIPEGSPEERPVRLMEIIVLTGLLKLKFRGKSCKYCSELAVKILILGWPVLDVQESI